VRFLVDETVLAAADEDSRILITADTDFAPCSPSAEQPSPV